MRNKNTANLIALFSIWLLLICLLYSQLSESFLQSMRKLEQMKKEMIELEEIFYGNS